MPGISLCTNTNCTLKKECFRFMCESNSPNQSYHLYQQDKNGKCEYFKPLKESKMTLVSRQIAEKYQDFFNFLSQEHGLILTISEMDEILFEAQKLMEKLKEIDDEN